MKRRNTNSPASVSTLPISDSTDRNCWSKPSSSIIHQVEPAPGPGSARNTKITTAVPISVARASGESSRVRRHISVRMIAIETPNISSCAKGTPPSPTASDIAAKAIPPPSTHQFTGGRCAWTSSAASACARDIPSASSLRRSRRRSQLANSTPATDTTGMISASSCTSTYTATLAASGSAFASRSSTTLASDTSTPPPMIATRPSVCIVVCIARRRSSGSSRPSSSTRGTASTVIASATTSCVT